MKKRNLLLLLLLMMLLPSAAGAQELPQLFAAVKDGLTEGLEQGAAMAYAGMAEELTVEMKTESPRIEEGKTLQLTLIAGNPRPQETKVTFQLKLPARLEVMQEAMWEAVLPAAQINEETGALEPSVTVFTRDILLTPGGGSEQVIIEAEMNMGTRFYRANAPLALCVADVSASAVCAGAKDSMLQPGDAYACEVEIVNRGTAPKDVRVEMVLPDCVQLNGVLPAGFAAQNGVISGTVRAEAAKGSTKTIPSRVKVSVPLLVAEDALEDDEDAMRLLTGSLRVDGKRIPLPRVQVCGPKINAQLLSDTESLKAGETTSLRMVVVNSGLAEADVQLSCVLPKGLMIANPEEEEEPADEAGAVLPEDDDSKGAAASAVLDGEPVMEAQDKTLVYQVHMDAAKETESGIAAATKVIEFDVTAETAQERIKEQLVGTALAWTVNQGETQLGEAVAIRVYKPAFLGIPKEDWNGLFWAGLLLMVTISLLYAAVRSDDKEEDFCCE